VIRSHMVKPQRNNV